VTGDDVDMTEREKLLAGKPYIKNEEFFEEQIFVRERVFDFNALQVSQIEKRNAILNNFFGKFEDRVFVEPPFYINYAGNILVGKNFVVNSYCHILNPAKIIIGDNVWLGANVCLFSGGHPIHPERRHFCCASPINIGNNVLIGGGAIVNPGVTIGDNTIIGAESVVTKDIPANVFAVGNPCLVIHEITDRDKLDAVKKEYILASKPYITNEILMRELLFSNELVFNFNTIRPREIEKLTEIIKKLFGQTGNRISIAPPFYCKYGYNISVGENFSANFNCLIFDQASVTIGNNVRLAPNVRIFAKAPSLNQRPMIPKPEYALPVTIGNNIWIGGGATINPGVTIGDNTVIGSGSVVTKNIPANVIAAGNPCRVIRKITENDKLYYFKRQKFEE
jgi:acetyltransferase-like isoleucine patch superfamily enzyme